MSGCWFNDLLKFIDLQRFEIRETKQEILCATAQFNWDWAVCHTQQQIQQDQEYQNFHSKFVIDEAEYEQGNDKL